nr:MAG TPA: hypothetical protein [Caudoviricetes sp.]
MSISVCAMRRYFFLFCFCGHFGAYPAPLPPPISPAPVTHRRQRVKMYTRVQHRRRVAHALQIIHCNIAKLRIKVLTYSARRDIISA